MVGVALRLCACLYPKLLTARDEIIAMAMSVIREMF